VTRSLQGLLLSIATGKVQRVRRHERGKDAKGEPIVVYERDHHPGLWEELQTTIARLSKMGGSAGTGAHSAESPVPYHRKASEVAHRLANTVSTWARAMDEEYDHLTLTATTIPAAARWLATFPTLLAEHPAADEMYSGILQVVKAAERVIDRAPDKVYAGPCYEPATVADDLKLLADPAAVVMRCPGQLYARLDDAGELKQTTVRCRDCSTRHDVLERRAWLSEQLGPMLVTAAEAAPVLSWMLDKEIRVDTIHKWRLRGRLQGHGELDGRPLYRFSEVEALAAEVRTRASKPRTPKEGSAA
jgi:hypothetical protein